MLANESVSKYNSDNKKVFELQADSLRSEDNIVYANGNATLINVDLYTIADEIIYNMDTRKVEASGDVRIYRDGNLLIKTKNVYFNLDDNYSSIEPLYMQDTQTGIWIHAKNALKEDNKYKLKSTILSSCDIHRPIWRMEASSGTYWSDKKTFSLWNPRVYIGDVPIFYFPYFWSSTDTSRQTGLLMPYMMFSNNEGFVYSQPFYVAPKNFFDITISPQFRTSRGGGGQIEFRAVDSHNNRTYIEVGYLYNSNEYKQRFNLLNQHVYGYRYYYSGRGLLQQYFKLKNNLDNGMYLNFVYMNDLDFYRLDKINQRIYDATYTSKSNTYIQTQNHYLGINIKYFLNLRKLSNDSTLHSLPNVQYHKYLDSLFFKGLLYSLDYQMKNTFRLQGYEYMENSLRIPIGLQFSLFKKYLSVGIWSEFYGENLFITDKSQSYFPQVLDKGSLTSASNGNIASANYSVSLNTDISRRFNRFFHTIQFEALFSGPYLNYSNGLLSREVGNYISTNIPQVDSSGWYNINVNGAYSMYNDVWNPSGISAYSVANQSLDVKMNQYFLNHNGREIVNFRIFQRLNFDELSLATNRINGKIPSNVIAKRPMEGKLGFSPINGLNISLSLFYSFYWNNMTEVATTLSYNKNAFNTSISYYLKSLQGYDYLSNTITDLTDPTNPTLKTSAHYIRANIAHDFRAFSMSATAGYDIEKNVLLDWDIGIYKNIRCFSVGLRFVNQRRPILTNTPEKPYDIQQNYLVRIMLSFTPIASKIGFTTRFN